MSAPRYLCPTHNCIRANKERLLSNPDNSLLLLKRGKCDAAYLTASVRHGGLTSTREAEHDAQVLPRVINTGAVLRVYRFD